MPHWLLYINIKEASESSHRLACLSAAFQIFMPETDAYAGGELKNSVEKDSQRIKFMNSTKIRLDFYIKMKFFFVVYCKNINFAEIYIGYQLRQLSNAIDLFN